MGSAESGGLSSPLWEVLSVSVELRMPQLGMMMMEGTVVRWLVENGACVQTGDDVLEIESDKVIQSISTPVDGVVRQVADEGQVVPVLEVLAYVEPTDESGARPGEESLGAKPSTATSDRPAVPVPSGETRATPIARRIAREQGIDLTTVAGSGPGGRIVEADVRAAIRPADAAPQDGQELERQVLRRIPLTGRRGVIAQRMMASLVERAQLTIVREVDASHLVRARQALVERAAELGVRVSYDAILAKALATALAEQPTLNATVESDEIVVMARVNVGIAVDAPAGLVVPVVHSSDSRSLVEIAGTVEDLAARAADGKLFPEEMTGGTVTITNMGLFGVDLFTPILNPPESAILGLGRIMGRPFVVDGELTVRPTLHLSLTWDHRVADGSEAGQLLARVAELIGDWDYLSSLA
jgi:pyruvate/2-oxoglutarate dehydrogenase complex dihydrolipoamide acyltransferase (E2) component